MFRHQGPARSERDNRLIAIYLAGVGGYVNSAGFLLIGTLTAHVTGNVGRLASQIVSRQYLEAGAAFSMVIAFYLGALVASMVVESRSFTRTPTAYGAAMAIEAVLLTLFGLFAFEMTETPPLMADMEALVLCFAMGVQNSLVTRLSGAVVRTTHLTGVVTDLGIETARWLAWWRHQLPKQRPSVRPRERPVVAKIRIHLTIVISFTVGAIIGCATAAALHHFAMLIPAAAVAIGAIYAFATARNAPIRPSHAPRERTPSHRPAPQPAEPHAHR
ncbi:MAG: YoaK family protein [Polyangiales bacterium]